MRILGFTWDEVNTAKLAHHDLTPDDVEALFCGECIVLRHPDKSGRWVVLGFVPDDRFVLVSFEMTEDTRWVRAVTAFEPTNERWWRAYAKAKDIKP